MRLLSSNRFFFPAYWTAVALLICSPFDVYNQEDIAIMEGQVLQRYLCFLGLLMVVL